MEFQKEFPKEYFECFKSTFDLLKRFNIRYLEDDQSFLKKYWRFFYIVPALLAHLVSSSTHMTILLSRKQIIDFAHMLPSFLVSVHATVKSFLILPKTAEISTIIRDLGSLWTVNYTETQTEQKNKLLKRLNFWNKVNYFVIIFGTGQYMILPILETLIRRFILHQDCDFLLPVAASYPFDPTQNWYIYAAVYLFQSYTLFLLVFVYSGAEMMLITLCGLLTKEFVMLKDDLPHTSHMVNENKQEDESGIEEFVGRHQKLIKLSQQLDNVFNPMIFMGLLFVGITTCAFIFSGEFSRGLAYTFNCYVGLANSLVTMFYLCYYCELLTSASADLGVAAYQTPWYNGSSRYKKAVWLIIAISQKTCCLTSLKYATVSLNTFTKVVSTTWSYFSLMNSVYNDEE